MSGMKKGSFHERIFNEREGMSVFSIEGKVWVVES